MAKKINKKSLEEVGPQRVIVLTTEMSQGVMGRLAPLFCTFPHQKEGCECL